MEDDQQFYLRCKTHDSTLVKNIDKLRESCTLVDCILSAEGKNIEAHKIILSASSPYFSNLFSENHHKDTMFVFKDIRFKELRSMIDFIYRGEIDVYQDELQKFVKAAEALQITGFYEKDSSNLQVESNNNPPKLEKYGKAPISVAQQSGRSNINSSTDDSCYSTGNEMQQSPESLDITGDFDYLFGDIFNDMDDNFSCREDSQNPGSRKRKKRKICELNSTDTSSQTVPQLEVTPVANQNPDNNLPDLFSIANLEQQMTVLDDEILNTFFENTNTPENVLQTNLPSTSCCTANEKIIDSTVPDTKPSKIPAPENDQVSNERQPVPYVCLKCGNRYKNIHTLNRHINFECEKEPTFECPKCQKKMKHKHNLDTHMKLHSEKKSGTAPTRTKPKIECPICKKKLKYKQNLASHIATHNIKKNATSHNETKPSCHICTKINCTSNPNTIVRKFDRKKNESTNNKFQCHICERNIKYKHNLYAHLRNVHNAPVNLKTEPVDNCTKKLNLKTEIKTESTFVCPICFRDFKMKCNLVRHLKAHEKKKMLILRNSLKPKFECNVRQKKIHQKTAHPKKNDLTDGKESGYPCPICSKTMKYERNLASHIEKHFKKNKINN